MWTRNGVRDLKNLTEKFTKHEKSITHMSNTVDLTVVGNVNIAEEIDSEYKLSIMKHNERVTKIRDAQSEAQKLKTRGLVSFSCSLNSSLDAHLRSAMFSKALQKQFQTSCWIAFY